MAYWAEIDEKKIVTRVLIGDDNEPDKGFQWLVDNLGGTWIETFLDGSSRKNYAGIGFTYDDKRDAFIPPQPFPSWILNEKTYQWESSIPYPSDKGIYIWDEKTQSWIDSTVTQ